MGASCRTCHPRRNRFRPRYGSTSRRGAGRGRGHGRGRAGGLGGTVRVIGAPRVEVGLKPLSDLHLGMRAAHRRVAGAPDGVVLAVVAGKQGPLLRRLLVRRLFSSKTGAPTLRGGR